MSRCIMSEGDQSKFLHSVLTTLNLTSEGMGKLVDLSGRTMRDWMTEKYLASYEAISILSKISNIPLPPILEQRDEWWSARQYAKKGGLATKRLYGTFLTLDARKLGGRNSWINRRRNVTANKSLGCIVANTFHYPSRNNQDFAEFVGIVLGDGGLTHSQLTITLNRIADHDYISYVASLIRKLFHYEPSLAERKHASATTIRVNGVDFIKFLHKSGIVVGNKVKLQVGVPTWITRDINLSKRCVRGLMDTDGCLFRNKYKVNGKWYAYYKTAFANKSQPLLMFVFDTLRLLGFNPVYYQNKQIRLCSQKETYKYLDIIGSSNPRIKKICY